MIQETIPTIEPEIAQRVAGMLTEGKGDIYRVIIQSVEKDLFHAVLGHFHGNRLKTSRALGISRFTLRKKLRAMSSEPTETSPEQSEATEHEELPLSYCGGE